MIARTGTSQGTKTERVEASGAEEEVRSQVETEG